MSASPFRFSPSVRRAALCLCGAIVVLLVFRHLSKEERQAEQIVELQLRIAKLEQLTAASIPVPRSPSVSPSDRPSTVPDPASSSRRSAPVARKADAIPVAGTASSAVSSTVPVSAVESRSDVTASDAASPWVGKFRQPTLVNLNTADSALLVRIPGIGEKTAVAIVRYRQRLGGYVDAHQVAEAAHWAEPEQVDEWCSRWFETPTEPVTLLDVNHAEFKQLLKHPYLEYEQVAAIFNYKRKRKGLQSFQEMLQLEEFTEADVARLKPYIVFK